MRGTPTRAAAHMDRHHLNRPALNSINDPVAARTASPPHSFPRPTSRWSDCSQPPVGPCRASSRACGRTGQQRAGVGRSKPDGSSLSSMGSVRDIDASHACRWCSRSGQAAHKLAHTWSAPSPARRAAAAAACGGSGLWQSLPPLLVGSTSLHPLGSSCEAASATTGAEGFEARRAAE